MTYIQALARKIAVHNCNRCINRAARPETETGLQLIGIVRERPYLAGGCRWLPMAADGDRLLPASSNRSTIAPCTSRGGAQSAFEQTSPQLALLGCIDFRERRWSIPKLFDHEIHAAPDTGFQKTLAGIDRSSSVSTQIKAVASSCHRAGYQRGSCDPKDA